MPIDYMIVVLNKFPSARCLVNKPGVNQYVTYWTIVDSSDKPLGATAVYSEADAWKYAAEKQGLLNGDQGKN